MTAKTFPCQRPGCPNQIIKTWGGPNPKWCSERCRKLQYSRPCVDCGKPLNGSDGRGPDAPTRCVACSGVRVGEQKRVWTPEIIIERMHQWAMMMGEPPAVPDWMPSKARAINDPARAERFYAGDGYWPHAETVVRAFGSWSNAMRAAGYEPRAAHGGGGNQHRQRRHTRKAAS
jgi:hypothetical protein